MPSTFQPTAEQLRLFGPIYEPQVFIEGEGEDLTDDFFDPGRVPEQPYYEGRATLVRGCVDALVAVPNPEGEYSILLVTRNGNPAKGQLWPAGGGMPRKIVGPRIALNANIARETKLELSDYVFLGSVDFGWRTTPGDVGYGKGIRDLGLMYYAQGDGQPQFKNLDNNPVFVTPDMWERKEGKLGELHQYVDKNMDLAMTLLVDRFYRA